jgi:hypothetical protein
MTPLPQEIIDVIIYQLNDNSSSRTLRVCSSVSWSFRLSCQRRIFNGVTLDTRKDERNRRFHDILTFNPAIQTFVRRLSLKLGGPVDDHVEMVMLRRIIPMLERVCYFTLHSDSELPGSWTFLPVPLKSTILNCIQSCDLNEVSVYNMGDFPIDCLGGVHLKEFSLVGSNPYEGINPITILEPLASSNVQLAPGSIHLERFGIGSLWKDDDITACQRVVESLSDFLEELCISVYLWRAYFYILVGCVS